MDFNQLVADKGTAGSIKSWANDGTLPSTDILSDAQAWIFQRLRVREMLKTNDAFTFAVAQSSAALPSDFLDPVQFFPYTATKELPYIHETAFHATRDSGGALSTGTPSRWTIIGTTAYVDVMCAANFGGSLIYYALPSPLSAGNTTNFLTARYPALLRHACLAYAYEFRKDNERMAAEFALAEQKIAEATATNDMFRRNQRASRVPSSAGMSFDQLVADKEDSGSIRNLIGKPDLAVELIMAEAQSWIFQRLRVREMLKTQSNFTFAQNTSSTALPADFLDPVSFLPWGWGCPLLYVHEEALRPSRDEDGNVFPGTPSRWAIVGTNASVDVLCDADFAGDLTYYAQPQPLASGNQTNFLTTRYPTLLRAILMAKGFEHIGNQDKAALYLKYAEASLTEAAATNDLFRRSQIYPV